MAKPLVLNEIRARAARFVLAWKDAPGDERQEAQSFVRDLLAVFGVTETKAAFYEKRVRRTSTGQRGYIDALVPGVALIEMKSAGKDLVAAERQALDYIDDLPDAEVPRFVLTSDFERFRLLDMKAADGEDVVEFSLADFPKNADRLRFFAGYAVETPTAAEQAAASIKAAQLMAGLYEALEGSGYDDHEASVFLVRTLFALYADDAGVWERDLFFQFLVDRTAEDGSDLGPQLALLYQVMSRPPERRQKNLDELVAQFPYVNGGIFEQPLSIPSFDKEMRRRILDAALFNWSAISPAVFGSLFQAVKDKKARRELGEHYTTETNILRLIGPMFLDDLRGRFTAGYNDAKKLRALRRDMGAMRFLDPACGCGNFLVVAYREMRKLDLDILVRLQELQSAGAGGKRADTTFVPSLLFDADDLPVRLEHFHGIELEEWPAQIAATALHLVEHQANQAMELALGEGPETLPLNKVQAIHVGNALRTDWTSVVAPSENLFVLGNPPFLGHATRDVDQAAELRMVWHRDDIGRLDYVTGWYAKALELFTRPGYDGEFAFVSTNSITQGEPVPALFRPVFSHGWRIKFAHRTFAWTSEAPGAAAVHCVIVGFDRRKQGTARLFSYADLRGDATTAIDVKAINGYLAEGPSVLVEQRRKPLGDRLPPLTMGNMARDDGNLIVEVDEYADVAADPAAAKYLRPFIGSRELIHGAKRWCLWLPDLDPADVAASPVLKKRLDAVRAFRSASRAASTQQMAETPHLFGQRSHVDTPHLVIPKVSSELRRFLPCAHVGPEVIGSDLVFTAEDPDGFAFAVVSSSMMMTWQRAVGGRLKSDLRFTNTLVWNTFPLPRATDAQRAAIIAGGQAVLDARALRPGNSLADHYNPRAMTPELLKAHRTLDKALDSVFDLRAPTEVGRLAALFSTYEKLTQGEALPLKKVATRSVTGAARA